MKQRAKDGTPLDELVEIAVKYCRLAVARYPRRGPGRPPEVPDWVIAAMVFVSVILRKKTKSAQHVWWCHHPEEFSRWFGQVKFPARSTFYERYCRCYTLFQQAIVLQGQDAVRKRWADAECVAFDKSLIAGRGQLWGPRDRRRNKIPKRVDPDTTWGYSKYDGWVQGYSFEVVLTASTNHGNWPLIASVDTASRAEQKSCLNKIQQLPRESKFVLADSGYDSNAVGEAVEGTRARRRFLCPEVPRPNNNKPRQSNSRQSRERQKHRRLRDARREFFHSQAARRLYARRKTTIEPYNNHLKQLFELQERTWHWGLANNQTQILAAIFAYQTLLTYNYRHRKRNTCIKAILDAL